MNAAIMIGNLVAIVLAGYTIASSYINEPEASSEVAAKMRRNRRVAFVLMGAAFGLLVLNIGLAAS